MRDPEEISVTAFTRFSELMADMGWNEEDAIEDLLSEIGVPLGLGKKAIEQWFVRRKIPGAHIFNLSAILGVSAEWLAGVSHVEKEDALRPGIYRREMRHQTRREGKRRTKQ